MSLGATHIVESNDGKSCHVTRRSTLTGADNTVTLPLTYSELVKGFQKMQEGELIQHVFGSLSPDEREFLISGCTASEWDTLTKNV